MAVNLLHAVMLGVLVDSKSQSASTGLSRGILVDPSDESPLRGIPNNIVTFHKKAVKLPLTIK